MVTHEETAITYTGPSIAVSGMSFTMSANLTTDGGPLGGRAVLMTLGSGSTAQSCTGTTNAAGIASCTIANVNQTAGSVPITVSFAGDAYYRPAERLGNRDRPRHRLQGEAGSSSVTSRPVRRPPATQVNFWGSQTWKTNQFSGVNNAPASMKGYIDNAPSYTCGAAWTSDPGNSSQPAVDHPGEHGRRGGELHQSVRVDRIRQHQAPRRGFGRTGVRPGTGPRRVREHHRHHLLSDARRRYGRPTRGGHAPASPSMATMPDEPRLRPRITGDNDSQFGPLPRGSPFAPFG